MKPLLIIALMGLLGFSSCTKDNLTVTPTKTLPPIVHTPMVFTYKATDPSKTTICYIKFYKKDGTVLLDEHLLRDTTITTGDVHMGDTIFTHQELSPVPPGYSQSTWANYWWEWKLTFNGKVEGDIGTLTVPYNTISYETISNLIIIQ